MQTETVHKNPGWLSRYDGNAKIRHSRIAKPRRAQGHRAGTPDPEPHWRETYHDCI